MTKETSIIIIIIALATLFLWNVSSSDSDRVIETREKIEVPLLKLEGKEIQVIEGKKFSLETALGILLFNQQVLLKKMDSVEQTLPNLCGS